MTTETPGPSLGSTESGFVSHPGDERAVPDYMGVVMPEEDAARYDNGGELDKPDDDSSNSRDVELPTESAERKKDEAVTILDKLRIVQEQFGFIPQSREELNEIWRIRKHLDKFGGSAADLNILLLHQSDPEIQTNDPQALLRKKVHTWGSYFRETTRNKTFIYDVAEYTAKNPKMSTAEVLQYYKRTVSYADAALKPIKTGAILGELAAKPDVDVTIAKNPFAYVDTIWEGSLGNVSRDKFKDIGIEAEDMNNVRHDFWRSTLEQARRHDVVRFLVADYIGPERPPDR